ncbi:hypothetical protein C9J47_06980 [Photobacterium indicum]|uniref:Uncharacterized protein n=1 Tax=Photobacterium indicum TaxID=81447 RepID=A0A2T3LAA2_9GAMM|nr:hypothetical protein C9J47_06980 [Photobacterium indicum]
MFKKQLVILIPTLVLTACGDSDNTEIGKDTYDYSSIDYSLIKGYIVQTLSRMMVWLMKT